MQTVGWYYRRMRAMAPRELVQRGIAALRDCTDRAAYSLGIEPGQVAAREARAGTPDEGLTRLARGFGGSPAAEDSVALQAHADAICAHQFSFLGLDDCFVGDPIDWNQDHYNNRPAPGGFAPAIDYRDFSVTGDCKYVWELNRQHQLVVLGRAYRQLGTERYARAAAAQWRSWLGSCPPRTGMNWRSPLELAVRLINWTWALALLRDAPQLSEALRRQIDESIATQVREIHRRRSAGSSANNHLIGEAAGVYIASTVFSGIPFPGGYRAWSRQVLEAEIERQIAPDGGSREQATGYLFFVTQFFLLAGLVGQRFDDRFSARYWKRLKAAYDFLHALHAGGEIPALGDADDGYVLDLNGQPHTVRPWLDVAAGLFDRPDWQAADSGASPIGRWLPIERNAARPQHGARQRGELRPRAFRETGYYLLQAGNRAAPDGISVGFDCGALGWGTLAAHGHADALSVTLRAFGCDVLVDPGTYDYFTYPAWRAYFRSTAAHNTVVVDGVDQSVQAGPFLWERHAEAACTRWEVSERGCVASGYHTGYRRLRDPVTHHRSVELDARDGRITIRDTIEARRAHQIAIHWHFGERCRVTPRGARELAISVFDLAGTIRLQSDPRLNLEIVSGSAQPGPGWVSRGYHRKVPASAAVARGAVAGNSTFITTIQLAAPARTSTTDAALGSGQVELPC